MQEFPHNRIIVKDGGRSVDQKGGDASVYGRLAERLKAGGVVYGTFVETGHPNVPDVAGNAAMDFIVVDLEHGMIPLDTVENMIRAADASGLEVVVRVPGVDESLIGRLLDAGASGVQVPRVSTRQEAEAAVAAARYSPAGRRGYFPRSRASGFGRANRDEFIAKSNAGCLAVVQVEGAEGARNVPEIVTVPGLDVLFIGPYDLSMSLGLPGQVGHPLVVQAISEIVAKARRSSVAIGIFADNPEAAKKWLDQGVRYMTVGIDTDLLGAAYRRILSELGVQR